MAVSDRNSLWKTLAYMLEILLMDSHHVASIGSMVSLSGSGIGHMHLTPPKSLAAVVFIYTMTVYRYTYAKRARNVPTKDHFVFMPEHFQGQLQ